MKSMRNPRCFDAIVVGAGPAGATAARTLAEQGLDVFLGERARLPRTKPCCGWLTWEACDAAGIDPATYPGRITAFEGAVIHGRGRDGAHATTFDAPASFGIERSELDALLVDRAIAAGARLVDGCAVRALRVAYPKGGPAGRSPLYGVELAGGQEILAPLLVGAGGYACPVARWVRPEDRGALAICLEVEQEVDPTIAGAASPHRGLPELFPEPDLSGFGWYVMKWPWGPFAKPGHRPLLDIGIGRVVGGGAGAGAELRRAAKELVARLAAMGRLEGIELGPFRGHAYRLGRSRPAGPAGAGILLAGDAAALAAPFTGEGIHAGILSGTMAGRCGASALSDGDCSSERMAAGQMAAPSGGTTPLYRALPSTIQRRIFDQVLRRPALRRRVMVEGVLGFTPKRHLVACH